MCKAVFQVLPKQIKPVSSKRSRVKGVLKMNQELMIENLNVTEEDENYIRESLVEIQILPEEIFRS